MGIDKYKEAFMNSIQNAMAGKGRQLSQGEIVIIDEFVKQAKENKLDLVRKE